MEDDIKDELQRKDHKFVDKKWRKTKCQRCHERNCWNVSSCDYSVMQHQDGDVIIITISPLAKIVCKNCGNTEYIAIKTTPIINKMILAKVKGFIKEVRECLEIKEDKMKAGETNKVIGEDFFDQRKSSLSEDEKNMIKAGFKYFWENLMGLEKKVLGRRQD